MTIRLRLRPDRENRSPSYVAPGVAVTLVGAVLALLAAADDHNDLLAIGALIVGSGRWVAGGHRLIVRQTPMRAIVGGLFTGWALIGAVAAAYHRV